MLFHVVVLLMSQSNFQLFIFGWFVCGVLLVLSCMFCTVNVVVMLLSFSLGFCTFGVVVLLLGCDFGCG